MSLRLKPLSDARTGVHPHIRFDVNEVHSSANGLAPTLLIVNHLDVSKSVTHVDSLSRGQTASRTMVWD